MPLDFQNVSIDFTGGLDRKTDEKLVLAGKLTLLQNAWFAENTSLSPVWGSTALTDALLAGGNLTAADALMAYRDELVRIANNSLYVFAKGGWVLRGNANDATVGLLTRKPVARSPASQTRYDIASISGVTVCAWVETGDVGGLNPYYVRAAVFDEATGARILSDALLDTATGGNLFTGVKCVAVTGAVMVFYWLSDGAGGIGSLYCRVIQTASPTTFGAAVILAEVGGTVDTDPTKVAFDAIQAAAPASAFVAVPGAGGSTKLFQVNRAGSVPSVALAPAQTTIAGWTGSLLTLISSAAGTLFVVRNTEYQVRSSTFGAVLGTTTYDATNTMQPVIGSVDGVTFTIIGADANNVARRTIVNAAGVVTAAANFVRTALPSGKPFVLDGRLFLPMVFRPYGGGSATVQPLGVVVEVSSGNVVARVLAGRASHAEAAAWAGGRPSVLVSGTTASFLASERGRLAITVELSGTARDVTRVGVSRIDFEIANMSRVSRVSAGKAVFIAGALPMLFDDVSLTEFGVHQFPENMTQVAGVGGALSAGTYQWRGLYEWLDAEGQLHRSAPSPALAVAGVTAGQSKKIRVPTLKATRRTAARAPTLHLFRTEHDGPIFYRATSVSSPRLNDPTVDYIEIDDGLSDANLIQNEVLYTTGGGLEVIAPPACKFAHVHRNRLWIGGLEDGASAWYTSKLVDGEAPRFHDALTLRLPIEGDDLTALGSLDERLILFTESRIYVVQGDGPDALGQNNTFTEPTDIGASVGCADWRSVVATDLGLFFLGSDGGIWVLTRGLQCVPIGDEVAGLFTASLFKKAIYVPELRQVRFIFSNVRLDYDVRNQQWSTATCGYGTDSVLAGSTVYRSLVSGSVTQETPGVSNEAANGGTSPEIYVETAWIKLGGLQGYQRVRRAFLLGGATAGGYTLSWDAGFDYVAYDTVLDRVTSALATASVGVMQLRRHMRKQKCEAVRFAFRFTPQAFNPDLTLTNLSLEVGLKKGSFKRLSAAQSLG